MAGNLKNDDLRVRRTKEALINSMFKLLNKQYFGNITVNELCEEALVSRAAFYSHFIDKYELLQYSLSELLKDIPGNFSIYKGSDIAAPINDFILLHKNIIKNIVENANETTLELFQEFLESFINKVFESRQDANSNYILTLKFCAGGIVNLLKSHVKNRFSANTKFINQDLCNAIECLLK